MQANNRQTLKYLNSVVSLQEVPNEISLIFQMTSCPHKCPGCHSTELWSDQGDTLSVEKMEAEIAPYKSYLSCICFFGGEWNEEHLSSLLKKAQEMGFKTCLYSGAVSISARLKQHLNYLKLGPWIEHLGGLDSIHTNQTFTNLDNGVCLNTHFQHAEGGQNATIK